MVRVGGKRLDRKEAEWCIVNIRSLIVHIWPASVNGNQCAVCFYGNVRLTIAILENASVVATLLE